MSDPESLTHYYQKAASHFLHQSAQGFHNPYDLKQQMDFQRMRHWLLVNGVFLQGVT